MGQEDSYRKLCCYYVIGNFLDGVYCFPQSECASRCDRIMNSGSGQERQTHVRTLDSGSSMEGRRFLCVDFMMVDIGRPGCGGCASSKMVNRKNPLCGIGNMHIWYYVWKLRWRYCADVW